MITSPGFRFAPQGPSHLVFHVIGFPASWLVIVIVYLLSRLPVMTISEVVVLPAKAQALTPKS